MYLFPSPVFNCDILLLRRSRRLATVSSHPLLVDSDTYSFSFVSFASFLAWSSSLSLHSQTHRCERTQRR